MLDKIKQLGQLRDQVNSLKNDLALEIVEVEKDGIKLIMNGNQEIISLFIPEAMPKEELEKKLPEIFNDGIKKVHRLIVAKMQAGNFNLPGF